MTKKDFHDKLKHGDLWLGKRLEQCQTREEFDQVIEEYDLEEWLLDEDDNE